MTYLHTLQPLSSGLSRSFFSLFPVSKTVRADNLHCWIPSKLLHQLAIPSFLTALGPKGALQVNSNDSISTFHWKLC